MSTIAQIQANRENSKLSTGPVTDAGKAVSSRNHLVHGLCSADPVLPTEDRNQFNQLIEQFAADWAPNGPHEEFLVSEMAGAKWKIDRITRIEASMLAALGDTLEKAFTDKETAAGFARLERYRASLERTYHRCARELRTEKKTQFQFEAKNRQAIEKASLDSLKAALFQPLPQRVQDIMDKSRRRREEEKEAKKAAPTQSAV